MRSIVSICVPTTWLCLSLWSSQSKLHFWGHHITDNVTWILGQFNVIERRSEMIGLSGHEAWGMSSWRQGVREPDTHTALLARLLCYYGQTPHPFFTTSRAIITHQIDVSIRHPPTQIVGLNFSAVLWCMKQSQYLYDSHEMDISELWQ